MVKLEVSARTLARSNGFGGSGGEWIARGCVLDEPETKPNCAPKSDFVEAKVSSGRVGSTYQTE